MPRGRPSNRDLLARTLAISPDSGGQQTLTNMFFGGQQPPMFTSPAQQTQAYLGMQPMAGGMMMMPGMSMTGMPTGMPPNGMPGATPGMHGAMPMGSGSLQAPPPLPNETPKKRRGRSVSSACIYRTRSRATSRKRGRDKARRNTTDSDDEISSTYKYVGGIGLHGARIVLPRKLRLSAVYKYDDEDTFNPIRCADMSEQEVDV